MENQVEIWKTLPGVTGVEVSTFGRVHTLDSLISSEKYTRFTKGRVLKQHDNHNGYMLVRIPVDGKWTTKRVHRLVAQTFIKNTDNLPQVNHLDCNRKTTMLIIWNGVPLHTMRSIEKNMEYQPQKHKDIHYLR